jgi:MFS family permease
MTSQVVVPPPKPGSAWAPLAHPMFRALWIAQLGSNVGVWMQTVGAQWFLVEETHSSALVAWVQTASLLPVILLSLFAGVLADSFDRRLVLLWSTVLSTLAAAFLTVLAALGDLQPWSLLLMTFVIGCSSALSSPAWQAIQPELVPRDEIAAAASLGSVTVNAARAIGPAIAGVLVALSGPALVFGLNAISFVGVIVALLVWKRPKQSSSHTREHVGEALSAGLRYVRSAPVVRRILLRSALFSFPASALWALLPAAAQTRLGVGSGGYGLLLGALGIGALLAVVIMPALRAHTSSSAVLATSALVFAVGTVSVAAWPFVITVILMVVSGAAWTATLTTLNAAAQLSLANWVRARGMATYLLIFMGSQAVGSFLWGWVSAGAGTPGTLLIAAGMLVLVAASVLVAPLLPQTGKLDRSVVALCEAAPALIFEPDPLDGPVLVSLDYRVSPDRRSDFEAAMRTVEQSRRRTGAFSWRLYRSGEISDDFREDFMVRSWGEFQRQSTDRWTRADQDAYDAALHLTTAAPVESHYFPHKPKKQEKPEKPD